LSSSSLWLNTQNSASDWLVQPSIQISRIPVLVGTRKLTFSTC
jgi:hypothetical protein